MKVKREIEPQIECGLMAIKRALFRAIAAINSGEPLALTATIGTLNTESELTFNTHSVVSSSIPIPAYSDMMIGTVASLTEFLKWQKTEIDKAGKPVPTAEKPSTSSPKTKARPKAEPKKVTKKRCARSGSARAPAKVVAAKVASSASKKKAKR